MKWQIFSAAFRTRKCLYRFARMVGTWEGSDS